MILTGSTIAKDDRVYHISMGYGTIVDIRNNQARVKMDAGGMVLMNDNGISAGKRAFYWHPPIVREFAKDEGEIIATAGRLYDLMFTHLSADNRKRNN